METIKNTDEADILGYFETIKSVFILKSLFLGSVTKFKDDKKYLELPNDIKKNVPDLESVFYYPLFFEALKLGNEELILNFHEDIITSGLNNSWVVFEQIIKTITHGDYSENSNQSSLNYENNRFQFITREKKDIALFYYLRNSIMHYNGVYYKYRSINHKYNGWEFKSEDNIGKKIIISPKAVYSIICDLENYTCKAWKNGLNQIKL